MSLDGKTIKALRKPWKLIDNVLKKSQNIYIIAIVSPLMLLESFLDL